MIETRMRAFEIDGHRTGIRLDLDTWAAIDWIAANQGRKWAAWAREKISNEDDYTNLTAVIRSAAVREILVELKKRDLVLFRSEKIMSFVKQISETT